MADVWETPCTNESYLAHFGLQVDPWNLDQCTECEFCGSCVAHICYRSDADTLLHLDWFKDFANPGEPECGSIGGPKHLLPEYEPRPCNLPPGHGAKHRARMGWSWPVVREGQPS
ncbi:hypothetical protein OG819_42820 [Streptomyces sp. NBC_01549]|uniref:hypothetical protein n=1 Tax=Streptomyces sp. NBC_01549 TaxID=2975874 RepID=UPI00225393C8|nr:hypothetical protein [Streptomyces sp. NBC_01549]MCX4596151.1 hypothetical protein [Streptomyces sp. NBC_01549]